MTYRELDTRLSCTEDAVAASSPEVQAAFSIFARGLLEELRALNLPWLEPIRKRKSCTTGKSTGARTSRAS